MGQVRVLLIGAAPFQALCGPVLRRAGHEVAGAETVATALTDPAAHTAVAIVDLTLPDSDGTCLVAALRQRWPDLPVLGVTDPASVGRAVAAMRAGAYDVLALPLTDQRLLGAVENAPGLPAADAISGSDAPLRGLPPPPGFVGSSAAMRDVFARIRLVARSMSTVFVTGECGTGKELCAEAIHALSDRADGPFVALNCGAIAPELVESDVFGHVKGALPGAVADKSGAAALADGGTLFLDEICDLDPGFQCKLLRFLQTSSIQPVGADGPHVVDVRIICATSSDPLEAVRSGRLREDLYYRLHVVPIRMPPLRERGQDAAEIAGALLPRIAADEGRRFTGLDAGMRALLPKLPWPGNVRQLLNVLRQIVVMNDADEVTVAMLPNELNEAAGHQSPPSGPLAATPLLPFLGKTLAQVERMVIEATIAMKGGSVTRAARVLDVAPSTLYRKIEAWGQDRGAPR